MRLYRSGAFLLSMSGRARQVVINTHGIWSAPVWGRNLKIGGLAPFRRLEHPGDGTVKVPTGSIVHFYAAHKEFGKRASADAVFAANPQGAYTGLLDNVRDVHARTVGPGEGSLEIKNYDLGHLEDNDRIWNDHQTNRFSPDIDLLLLAKGGECHLSDAFRVCREARGSDYEVYHCCHCRFVDVGHE